MSLDLNRVYEQEGASKEDALSSSPKKVSGWTFFPPRLNLFLWNQVLNEATKQSGLVWKISDRAQIQFCHVNSISKIRYKLHSACLLFMEAAIVALYHVHSFMKKWISRSQVHVLLLSGHKKPTGCPVFFHLSVDSEEKCDHDAHSFCCVPLQRRCWRESLLQQGQCHFPSC